MENYEAVGTSDDEFEDQLRKGEIRVVWHPEGKEEVLSENNVSIFGTRHKSILGLETDYVMLGSVLGGLGRPNSHAGRCCAPHDERGDPTRLLSRGFCEGRRESGWNALRSTKCEL